jgi:hypothetical protein
MIAQLQPPILLPPQVSRQAQPQLHAAQRQECDLGMLPKEAREAVRIALTRLLVFLEPLDRRPSEA